jgi:hypothetical protein
VVVLGTFVHLERARDNLIFISAHGTLARQFFFFLLFGLPNYRVFFFDRRGCRDVMRSDVAGSDFIFIFFIFFWAGMLNCRWNSNVE